eukprot:2868311-Prorocentrum_lima.AAC.1
MYGGVAISDIAGMDKLLGCSVGTFLAATTETPRSLSTCIEGSGPRLAHGSGVVLCTPASAFLSS